MGPGVAAAVRLGRLKADDIAVEIYHGPIDSSGNISDGQVTRMSYESNGQPENTNIFTGAIPCMTSGKYGFALRVMPNHPDLDEPYEPGMILWESAKQ